MAKSLRAIMNRTTYSAYVKAAIAETRSVEVIKDYLATAENRANNSEHNLALCEAIIADDFEIAELILQYTHNTQQNPIDPFTVSGTGSLEPTKKLVDNALRHASSELLRLLLKQPQICRYLQTINRDAYTFSLLSDFLQRSNVDARTKCELVAIAANGNATLIPHSLSTASVLRKDFDLQRQTILFGYKPIWGFKQLTAAAEKGLRYLQGDSCRSLPGLPRHLIHKIYELAIGDEDLLDQPLTKRQVLKLTLKS